MNKYSAGNRTCKSRNLQINRGFKGNHKLRRKIKSLKELLSINKVITLLKFKSAVNFAMFLIGGAIERARPKFALTSCCGDVGVAARGTGDGFQDIINGLRTDE